MAHSPARGGRLSGSSARCRSGLGGFHLQGRAGEMAPTRADSVGRDRREHPGCLQHLHRDEHGVVAVAAGRSRSSDLSDNIL